jgi:hypothetical protein
MGERNSQNIAQITQRHKGRQTSRRSTLPKYIPEEETSDDDFRLGKVRLGDGCEIGHVSEDVKNRDATYSDRRCDGEGFSRIFQFAEDVVCVFPAFVTVDDVKESVGVGVCATAAIAVAIFNTEGVVEVVRIRDASMAGKGCEAREDDKKKNNHFKYAQNVEESNTPFGKRAVKKYGKGDACHSYTSRFPPVGCFPPRCIEDVPSKSERVTRRKAKKDHLTCQDTSSQVFRVSIDPLEIILFAARSRNRETEFQKHAETAKSQEATDDP